MKAPIQMPGNKPTHNPEVLASFPVLPQTYGVTQPAMIHDLMTPEDPWMPNIFEQLRWMLMEMQDYTDPGNMDRFMNPVPGVSSGPQL